MKSLVIENDEMTCHLWNCKLHFSNSISFVFLNQEIKIKIIIVLILIISFIILIIHNINHLKIFNNINNNNNNNNSKNINNAVIAMFTIS